MLHFLVAQHCTAQYTVCPGTSLSISVSAEWSVGCGQFRKVEEWKSNENMFKESKMNKTLVWNSKGKL